VCGRVSIQKMGLISEMFCNSITQERQERLSVREKIVRELIEIGRPEDSFRSQTFLPLSLSLSCGASLDFSSIIAVIVARSRNLIYATELINYTCAHMCARARTCMRQILFAKRQKIDCLALHLCRLELRTLRHGDRTITRRL